jgi:hypothetical protein
MMLYLVYDFLGLVTAGGGIYFLWRGSQTLEAGSLVAGLLTMIAGFLVFRSGLELIKVGAASRVVASRGQAETEDIEATGRRLGSDGPQKRAKGA